MLTVGFALTGSYCTFSKVFPVIQSLVDNGYRVIPIFSNVVSVTDTRFGMADEHIKNIEKITGNRVITTIKEAEPIGPKKLLDILVIAPCTGNTLAKLAHGIADTPVTLAAKSHLRNNNPIVVAVSTNDGLAGNAKNIGTLLARKHFFFVPFGQDDWKEKPNSLVSDFSKIPDAVFAAKKERQIQPILI